MATLPRGIAPELLLSQVQNTMPYLFASVDHGGRGHLDGETVAGSELESFPPARVLRDYATRRPESLTHFEYFRLCLSSHYLTCATPVPTDVDNQIRQKLWPAQLPIEVALEMANLILESRRWDFTAVSERCASGAAGSPWAGEWISGHLGEWFTVAAGAYCALGRTSSSEARLKRQAVFDAVDDEFRRHSELFLTLWKARDGIGALRASASVAHNLGDLDRVMDMWNLDLVDPFRLRFYKAGLTPFDAERRLRFQGIFWTAGQLYKSEIQGSSMALENHRHFALRKPRALRRSRRYLIPLGPFFDDWGSSVAKGLLAESSGGGAESLLEVADALAQGWVRLPGTWSYGRALRAMKELCPEVRLNDLLKSHATRAVLETPREAFEHQWNERALRELDDIPSRAS